MESLSQYGIHNNEYNERQLKMLNMGIFMGVDISYYAYPELDDKQMWVIFEGLVNNLDVTIYNKPWFTHKQMEVLFDGLQNNINVKCIARTDLNHKQMYEILIGIMNGVNMKRHINRNLTAKQLKQIRIGEEHNIDTSTYAYCYNNVFNMFINRILLEHKINPEEHHILILAEELLNKIYKVYRKIFKVNNYVRKCV